MGRIRGKTKYYKSERLSSPRKSSNKSKKTSPRTIHSKNIFLEQYTNKTHAKTVKKRKRKRARTTVSHSMSKRKSLPTKTKQKELILPRRASDGNRSKSKYLIHLDELSLTKRVQTCKSLRKHK